MDSANDYWDTLLSFDTHELDCWGLEDAFSGYSDSSSPDGIASSSAAKKSIAQERDRRKKFNEKLYALRSLVPSITKMDKVSIVKDAIDYIAELQEQERMLLAEISALEQDNGRKRVRSDRRTPPGKRRRFPLTSESTATSPVNVEVQVSDAGDSSCTVSVACSGKRDIVGRLCHALEFLPFDILAASITSFSGNVLHTLLLHTRGTDGRLVEETIKEALGAL